MKTYRLIPPTVAVLALLSGLIVTAQQPAHAFWLGAADPVVQNDRKGYTPTDYMEVFGPPTKWPTVSAKISTFEISTQLVMRGTDEEWSAVLAGLKLHHFKLAGQFGVLEQPADPKCGGHMEGMGTPQAAENVARKLLSRGGTLDYLDMDEPVTWGREATRNHCPQELAAMADVVAKKVAIYLRYFPKVKVNLIDAIGDRVPRAAHDEVAFIDMLGQRGVRIEFFIADVAWNQNWRPMFEEVAVKLHARGIKVGLYCDGNLDSNTTVKWDRDSVNNCKTANGDAKIAPDMFMIGSWSQYPTTILPENEPGTLTHIGKQLMTLFP